MVLKRYDPLIETSSVIEVSVIKLEPRIPKNPPPIARENQERDCKPEEESSSSFFPFFTTKASAKQSARAP
jgi:hypothetical protein